MYLFYVMLDIFLLMLRELVFSVLLVTVVLIRNYPLKNACREHINQILVKPHVFLAVQLHITQDHSILYLVLHHAILSSRIFLRFNFNASKKMSLWNTFTCRSFELFNPWQLTRIRLQEWINDKFTFLVFMPSGTLLFSQFNDTIIIRLLYLSKRRK